MEYTNVELSKKAKEIQDAFAELPPDYDKIKKMFAEYQPTEAEMVMIAIDVIENVSYDDELESVCINGKSISLSDFAYDSMKLLLGYGLNIHAVVDQATVLVDVKYIRVKDLAAKIMRLLLENGGNPNVEYEFDKTPLMSDYWTDANYNTLSYGLNCSRQFIQCLCLLAAYGGVFSDGSSFEEYMVNNHKVIELKRIEDYDIRVDGASNSNSNMNIIVFNKETKEIFVKIECGCGSSNGLPLKVDEQLPQTLFKNINKKNIVVFQALAYGYKHCDFSDFFKFLTNKTIWESMWVFTPMQGKNNIVEYLTGKAKTLQNTNCNIETEIVCCRSGEGGVLVRQQFTDGKQNEMLIILSFTVDNELARVDLCMPGLYSYEKTEKDIKD